MKHIGHSIIGLAILLASVVTLRAQDQVTLQFTGQKQNSQFVQLTRVLVENTTKHWQEVLYYPDTTLFISTTGIEEFEQVGDNMHLFQNVPNPFEGVTDFALQLPQATNVQLEIYDINGKVMATHKASLDQGCHQFRAWLTTPQTYLLQARTHNGTVQIKMVNTGHAGKSQIEYIGKGALLSVESPKNGSKGSTTMPFNYGDTMAYTGYAHIADMDFTSSTTVKAQYNSELIPLTFTLPLPTVTTEAASNIYATEAWLNGSVIEDTVYSVTERGFLFADNQQLIGAVEHLAGNGSGNFYYTVHNLQAATRYYYRAYAQTAMGITYGDVMFFDTQAETPVVQTLAAEYITSYSATCGGQVIATGGAYVTARGICWSTSQNPTINNNHTTDGTGTGDFTSILIGLLANTTYYVRAYAVNSVGIAYGNQISFTTLPPSPQPPFYCGIDTVTDYDGNCYHTVEIGQQCWMKENMRATHYSDGTEIPLGTTASSTGAYRYAPNNDSNIVPTYGYLYNWAAVMHGADSSNANPSGVQGICPPGWHVPSISETDQFVNYVSSLYDCGDNDFSKALASTSGWDVCSGIQLCKAYYNQALNNATGFTAYPAGDALIDNQIGYYDIGRNACFWTTTSITLDDYHFGDDIGFYGNLSAIQLKHAYSVRCLLDDSGVSGNNAITPIATTKPVSDITSTTAICGGQVNGSGGTTVSARGLCWGTSPNPTVSDSHTTDGSGTGGFFSHLTGLTPGTTYYVRAYATNSVGTAYGTLRSFTTTYPVSAGDSVILIDAQSCPGADTLTDYDGNTYQTVQIGQQCWMKENLRTTHYADGTEIPLGTTQSTTVAYHYILQEYNNHVPICGYLYNWPAVMHGANSADTNPSGVQGICPTGWHLPSRAEFEQLRNYVSSQPQYWCGGDSTFIAKALAHHIQCSSNYTNNSCHVTYNQVANNATGFSAFIGGYYYGSVGYGFALFWSATKENYPYLLHLDLNSNDVKLYSFSVFSMDCGLSVRCLRD